MSKEMDNKNRAIVAAMTDEELKKIKDMITDEQYKRIGISIEKLGK